MRERERECEREERQYRCVCDGNGCLVVTDLALRMESISSMKMTAGCRWPARVKSVRTIFSPSPIHFEVKLEALMLKKVALMFEAMALPIRVFPVPGGPKSSKPCGVGTQIKKEGNHGTRCQRVLSLDPLVTLVRFGFVRVILSGSLRFPFARFPRSARVRVFLPLAVLWRP